MSEVREVFNRNRSLFFFLIGLLVCCILIYFLWKPLLPFLIGLLIAYIFLPVVDWIDKRLPFKKKGRVLQRILIILITFIVILAIIGIIVFFTFSSMSKAFTALPATIIQGIEDIGSWFDLKVKLLTEAQQKQVYDAIQNISNSLGSWLQNSITSGISAVFSTFVFLLGFFTLPFFLVFFMTSFHQIKSDFGSALPAGINYHTRNFFKIMDGVFGRYIRAQLIIAIIIGVIVTICLEILGIGLAPALGFIAGAFQLIPTIGGFIAAIIGILVTMAIAPSQLLWVIIIYVLVNLVVGSVLIAKLSGDAVKMRAAIVMVLIVIGGFLGGLAGMILIVPVVAVVYSLYKYVLQEMEKTKIADIPDSEL